MKTDLRLALRGGTVQGGRRHHWLVPRLVRADPSLGALKAFGDVASAVAVTVAGSKM